MFRPHCEEHSNKSSRTTGNRGRGRSSRRTKHTLLRHCQFETLEDRCLLSAGPTTLGNEFLVNTYTTGAQTNPAIASSAAGDYVVVWQSPEDGSGYGIYGQRYNPAGEAQGSEFRVNTYTTGLQAGAAVAMDALGDFVVAWESVGEDGSLSGVYAQRYNSSGVAQGSEFLVNTYTTGNQITPKVAMDSAGDFVVAWASQGEDGSDSGVYAQRYNASGAAQGSEFRVNTYTTGNQENPSVAMDSAGDFVVAWQSAGEDGSLYGVYAQRYNAAGSAQGSEFRVNTYTTGNQQLPSIAMDYAGDFVVAWESYGQAGTMYGVYAQRYSNTGATLGTEFKVNTYTTGSQSTPAVAMDSTGDFVVTWNSYPQDGSQDGVYAQAYTSRGVASGSEFKVNTYTTSSQSSPTMAMDQSGNFVVAWDSDHNQDGSSYGIYGQRYAGNYTLPPPAGHEFQVNTYTTNRQQNPKTAADAAGAFVVVWDSGGEDGSQYGIYAQRYNAAGAAQGSEFRVNTYTTGNQTTPAVAMDAAGDFVVAWTSYGQDGSKYGVYAQRYNAAGTAQGSEFRVNTYTTLSQDAPTVAMDSAGDFVVAWQGGGNEDGSFYGVYAQRYNASGAVQGSEFQVNTYTTGNQALPSVAMDYAGDFVVAWQSNGEDGSLYGVYAQRYNASGVAQGSEFRVNTYTTGDQEFPTVAMDSTGDFVVAWQSPEDGANTGIYAQRYNSSGAVQGSQFQVNTYTTNFQTTAAAAMDAAGDFVVSWDSYTQDGSNDGIYAQAYNSSGATVGGEFLVNTYTTGAQANPAVAMDATGDFIIAWQSYTQDGSGYGVYAQRYTGNFAITQTSSTLTINGAGLTQSNPLQVTFTSPTAFDIVFNGTTYYYDTSTVSTAVYNGVAGRFSEAIFDDIVTTDDYTATQSLSLTKVTRTGGISFEFDSNNAQYLYVYSTDPASTATVSVSTGTGNNFYVGAANGGYSYVADPVALIYSELSGFPSQTVTGSNGTTYAYIYSTTDATVVADPKGSTLTVGSAVTTLGSFTQTYVVGAADGTDHVTLNSEGGAVVVTPPFTSVQGTLNSAAFTLGALYCANVIAQASVAATDTAFVYSFASNTFNGVTTGSSLTGTTMNAGGTSYSFTSQLDGYPSITVLESGAGTDVANLNSPGSGTFTSTPTVSTLAVGGVTIFTINTFVDSSAVPPVPVAVPNQINMIGKGNNTDIANLYDGTGTNALVASGNTATIKRNVGNGSPVQTVAVSDFEEVTGFQTQGTNDTVHEVTPLDFAFQTVGNWTSV